MTNLPDVNLGMTEREKMLAGQPYRPDDAELVAARLTARRLTRLYNTSLETDAASRRKLLDELFGSLGPKAEIEPPFRCDYGANIHAGERLFINFGCVILDCGKVTIGDQVMFGPNVQLYAAHHPLDPVERSSGYEFGGPITIGHRVWIGGGAIILDNVSIGDGSIIGAGSVVTKDIPANIVAVGNPCRIVRSL
jgi:maltose O-acetyltransferase